MKRKFRIGERISDFPTLLTQKYVMFGTPDSAKTKHVTIITNMPVKTVVKFFQRGLLHQAIRLTNGEFYNGLSLEQVSQKAGFRMCRYCENQTGHSEYCNDVICEAALNEWLKEAVE